MYTMRNTSLASCNLKTINVKFNSNSWGNEPTNSNVQTQQPTNNEAQQIQDAHIYSSMQGEPDESNGGGRKPDSRPLMPLPSMDGVPSGLEFLIDMTQITVNPMVELFDIMRDYETGHYKLYNIINGSSGRRIYFAAVQSPPRENACDVQRKFKVNIVDYSGRIVLILERPYSCALDATNNCWMCCCCWFGSLGGKLVVKTGDGSLIGEIEHSFACYGPKYNVIECSEDFDATIMRINGGCCGDCCNVLCQVYCNCNRPKEFSISTKDYEQRVGTIKKIPVQHEDDEKSGKEEDSGGFGVDFPKNLGLKWKAMIVGALFLIDFMYFENGPTSAQDGH